MARTLGWRGNRSYYCGQDTLAMVELLDKPAKPSSFSHAGAGEACGRFVVRNKSLTNTLRECQELIDVLVSESLNNQRPQGEPGNVVAQVQRE
jgi:hypothetical protein